MTLTEFSRDVIPIIAAIFSGVSLVSLLLLWQQIKQATDNSRQALVWNRNNAHHTFFANTPNPERERKLAEEMKRIQLDPDSPLTNDLVTKVKEDAFVALALRQYLNEFEELCAAVNAGTVDEDLAFCLDSSKTVRVYSCYALFIHELRNLRDDGTIYLELEKVATRWESRTRAEKGKIKEELQAVHLERQRLDDLEKHVGKPKGVKPRVIAHTDGLRINQ